MRRPDVAFMVLLAACAAAFGVAIHLIFNVAPVERYMGIVQKIFYFHVPSAYAMYLGVALCAIGSAVFLLRGNAVAEGIARAGGEIAVLFGLIVLTTGPIWARKAWGTWWTWEPRLTTTLLLVLIFVAYLVLRGFGEGLAERKFAAVLAVLGTADLPIIHYAVQKWRGHHPQVITGKGGGLEPRMLAAFLATLAAFTLLFALLAWLRAREERLRVRLAAARIVAIEAGWRHA